MNIIKKNILGKEYHYLFGKKKEYHYFKENENCVNYWIRTKKVRNGDGRKRKREIRVMKSKSRFKYVKETRKTKEK